ncbi:MAG: dephospho-CoA kinase [Myxococcota bacterium]|nr:dephospho-CoA kinase [Myxococcota bacterium]
MASGKSTVARQLRDLGVPVVDADRLAREVVEPGAPALEQIQRRFGAEMIQEDGTLNRAALGRRVFGDPEELKALNAITHPAILSLAGERLRSLANDGYPWAVWEAALILENALHPPLSELVVVICDPEEQVRRIQSRNGLTDEEARARISAQVDNATRRSQADVLLDNDGPPEHLERQVEALHTGLVERHGSPVG